VVRAIKGLCGEAHGLGFDSPWDKTSDLSGELWRWVAALAPYMGLVSPKVGTCYKKKKKKKRFFLFVVSLSCQHMVLQFLSSFSL